MNISDLENKDSLSMKESLDYANYLLHEKKLSEEDTIKTLISKGLSEENAQKVVSNFTENGNGILTDSSKLKITIGAISLLAGILISVITYHASSGGVFLFAWGAIAFGLFFLIKGLSNS